MREDSQSVSSLDLQRAKSSSKEGSPAGGDSQSVSSLEFPKQDTLDDRSVASLELQATSLGAETPSAGMEESFGEFSSVTDPHIASDLTSQQHSFGFSECGGFLA